jgi:hypothetical protein
MAASAYVPPGPAGTLAGTGLEHVLISPRQAWDEGTLEAVASIVPEVHAMPCAT